MGLDNAIAFLNGKGGCGKTSILVNTAGIYANSGAKVLIVNLDHQNNLARNLGYLNDPRDDQGVGLAETIIEGQPLTVPLKGVRENLDVIPGGAALEAASIALSAKAFVTEDIGALRTDGIDAVLERISGRMDHEVLYEFLEPIADEYDLVLIDGPPAGGPMTALALGTANSVVVPVNGDVGTLDGLAIMASHMGRARNDDLKLLGVALFQIPTNATRMAAELRQAIEATLDGAAPVFDHAIRMLPTAGFHQRRDGLLSFEYQAAAEEDSKGRFQALQEGKPLSTRGLSSSAKGLAADYVGLAQEILNTFFSVQAQQHEGSAA